MDPVFTDRHLMHSGARRRQDCVKRLINPGWTPVFTDRRSMLRAHGGETRPGGQEQRSQWHGQQHCLAPKT